MTVYIISIAVLLVFFARDVVKEEVKHVEVYTREFQDPYVEYDAFEDALEHLKENNSTVEVLIKPCDTKVDRSS